MPPNFKDKYPNTVIIIDATELRIQTPSSLLRQSQSYSSYKSTNTFKSLIGVDAKVGLFLFLSFPWVYFRQGNSNEWFLGDT